MQAYGDLVMSVADQIHAAEQTPGAGDTWPGREAVPPAAAPVTMIDNYLSS